MSQCPAGCIADSSSAVRLEYQMKRDFLLDCLAKYVSPTLVRTKPCGGGMFQWLEVDIPSHPRYKKTPISDGNSGPVDLTADTASEEPSVAPGLVPKSSTVEHTTNTGELMDELWSYLVEEGGVLLMPAKIFQVAKPGVDQTSRLNYFRATVCSETMYTGMLG